MRQALLPLALLVPVLGLNAQDTGTLPAFEVASIKQSQERPTSPPGPVPPDRFIRRYITLAQLLAYAHDVTALQIQGGPDWMTDTRFDVEGKSENRPTAEQIRTMVRRLLADRFSLKVHVETKELPRFVLVKARADGRLGEKLRPSAIDCPALIAARPPDYQSPTGLPRAGDPPRCAVMTRGTACTVTLFFEGTPMSELARTLQGQTSRLVVDSTSLVGTFDIELEMVRPNVSAQAATQCEGPSLVTALQEQLGLKLESDRGPVEVLVIDSVERPTPD